MRQYMNLVESFVDADLLQEASEQTVIVYHGSNHEIEQFRFDNLRHRTGTPGTLSFTQSLVTARIYGDCIYEVEVSGNFGDYVNRDDVEKVYQIRRREQEERLRGMAEKAGYDVDFSEEAELRRNLKLRREISNGYYAMWENCRIWKELGWDGAWCFESESRNLIVGRGARIKIIGKISPEQPDDNW